MIYLVYSLILLTVCVFSVTSSQDQLVQTLVNYIPKEIAFFFISSLTISYSFINKKVNGTRLNNKFLFAFMAFIIFQFIWYFYKPIAMIDPEGSYSLNIKSIRPYINIFTGVLLIKVLSESLMNKDWVKIFKCLAWVGFLLSVYSILQWFGIDWSTGSYEINYVNGKPENKQLMYTFLSHRSLTAAYIALTVPLCLMFKERRYKAFILVMLTSLFLLDSLVAIASVMVSVSVFLILSKRFKILLGVFVLCGCALFACNKTYDNFFSHSGRTGVWKKATVDVLKNKPFIGYGQGSFARKYDERGRIVLFAHNDYVQGLNAGGIPLFVILICYTISIFYRGLLVLAKDYFIMDIALMSCLVGVVIVSNGTFLFYYPPLAVLGILYISYIEYRHSTRS